MSHKILEGKRGIIFGAFDSKSIAWQAALTIFSAGAKFTLTNTAIAARLGSINLLAQECDSTVILADATSINDLEKLIIESQEILGGKIDFILHSLAMSKNIKKANRYNNIDYDDFFKTIDVSALSFHKIIQTLDNLDALNEYASIIGVSYIAANRAFPSYSDMAEAKAMLESIARSFGLVLGPKKQIRINTISQSPTFTLSSQGINQFADFYDYSNKNSPLGNASAEDCAKFITVMFSDYTRKITMQNIMHDGGFSTTGFLNF